MHINSLLDLVGAVSRDLTAISRTRKHRQTRVARKSIVGLREAAERELAAAMARDDDGVRTCRAQAARDRLPRLGGIVHDELMFTSETVTRGVRVSVLSEYSADRSRPTDQQWFFLYTITITNEGQQTVQLLARHWIITHGNGRVEEVKGPGVVGQQPVLKPGEHFEYTSGCVLETPRGSMRGTYQMHTPDGKVFDAEVARLQLAVPRSHTCCLG